jgi:altronate dehydratase large subunit
MLEFTGYARQDGTIGIRNLIAAVPASVCASPLVTRLAVQHQDVVGLAHTSGCCQLGDDFQRTTRVLQGLATNPNVGAVLLVALGCEGTPSEEILQGVRRSGRPVRFIHIQDAGGSRAALQQAAAAADQLSQALREQTDTREATARDLVVGLECGGSDATSGLASNPAIGRVTDRLVQAGARVILSETTELIGAEHVITRNVADPEVKQRILGAVQRVERQCIELGVNIRGSQPTPGNIQGGLSTIEEKSLGCVHKGGSSPIIDFLDYGQRVRRAGLSFMDTPGQDVESMTGMAAGGATVFLFSTGRGSPVGFPIVPTIKVTGNEATYRRMQEDIDVDVSCILRGDSIQQAGDHLFNVLAQTCRGALTCSEQTGYHAVGIFQSHLTL